MEITVLKMVVTLSESEMEKFLKITPDAFGTQLEVQRWELASATYYENRIILSPSGLADLVLYLTCKV